MNWSLPQVVICTFIWVFKGTIQEIEGSDRDTTVNECVVNYGRPDTQFQAEQHRTITEDKWVVEDSGDLKGDGYEMERDSNVSLKG